MRYDLTTSTNARHARQPGRTDYSATVGFLLIVAAPIYAIGALFQQNADAAVLPVLAAALGVRLYWPAIRRIERADALAVASRG